MTLLICFLEPLFTTAAGRGKKVVEGPMVFPAIAISQPPSFVPAGKKFSEAAGNSISIIQPLVPGLLADANSLAFPLVLSSW